MRRTVYTKQLTAMCATHERSGRTRPVGGASAALYNAPRLRAVRATGLLDGEGCPRLSRLARVARHILSAPTAAVTLVDAVRCTVVGQSGLTDEAPRSCPVRVSPLPGDLLQGHSVVIQDVLRTPVQGALQAFVDSGQRAFAGMPLINRDGHAMGALWVADLVPRPWSADDLELLADVAVGAVAELESRIASRALAARQTPARGVPLLHIG
jgi:GAF domain-containing protein